MAWASACGPARKLAPVGVSAAGAGDREHMVDGAAPTAMLAGLPPNFRTTWTHVGTRIASEHGRFLADAYEDGHVHFAEDLFEGDAGAGVYLIERTDAGPRFAVADVQGGTVADSALDAGPSVEACVRCHANATGSVYPVMR